MSFESIRSKVSDRVGWLVLDRPEKLNALDRRAMGELRRSFEDLLRDEAVSVIVLTGAGDKAFTAGVDIGEFLRLDARSGQEWADEGRDLTVALQESRKPVIAALNGFAVGAGTELALACHIRLAADSARLGLTEVRLGLIPGFGGTQRLARLIGPGAALELILSGRIVDAREALALGLVNRVVPAAELESAALGLAREIAANAPLALEHALEAVLGGLDRPLAEGLSLEREHFARVSATQDLREGARAFLEKRKPNWSGR